MTNYEKHQKSQINLSDAVDALSVVAELEISEDSLNGIDDSFILNEIKNGKKLSFFATKNGELDVQSIKEVFRTILRHLKAVYKEDSYYIQDEKKNERVKSMMILVGEAVNKFEKLTALFKRAKKLDIHDLKEYKDLQEFYTHRIAKRLDDQMLSQWILGIAKQEFPIEKYEKGLNLNKHPQANHVFIDLEGVKKDSEYELFYIRKEDGTRFFSPKLIRSMKLTSDFGSYFKGEKRDDPFDDINYLVDKMLYNTAKEMVHQLKGTIHLFYHESSIHKKNDLITLLHKAFIALLLAANSKNLLKNHPNKSSTEYFKDFQGFIRESLHTREYQKMILYPEVLSNKMNQVLKSTIETVIFQLHLSKPGLLEITTFIDHLIHEASHELKENRSEEISRSQNLSNQMALDYQGMSKMMKCHLNGHLKKILDSVEEGNYNSFDPIMHENLPMELYHLYQEDIKMVNLRIPAPIYQELIDRAKITEEFKAFLRSLKLNGQKLLLINTQDRTSWREHARSKVLEDLQNLSEFEDVLTVVTLSKDTEFYHQDSIYENDHQTVDFILHLKEHLESEHAGFYIPESISKQIFGKFLNDAIKAIHHIFFHSKNVLTKDQRLDFIDILYFFLELKFLDLIKPDFYAMVCKDGIDISTSLNVNFFAFLTLINQEKLSESDKEFLDLMLYASPLINRERLMLQDTFDRMLSSIKRFESVKDEYGSKIFSKIIKEAFVLLYDTSILDARITPIR